MRVWTTSLIISLMISLREVKFLVSLLKQEGFMSHKQFVLSSRMGTISLKFSWVISVCSSATSPSAISPDYDLTIFTSSSSVSSSLTFSVNSTFHPHSYPQTPPRLPALTASQCLCVRARRPTYRKLLKSLTDSAQSFLQQVLMLSGLQFEKVSWRTFMQSWIVYFFHTFICKLGSFFKLE